MAQGDRSYIMAPQESAPALDRLLLALTEARAQGNCALQRASDPLALSRSPHKRCRLVVVTPSVDPVWVPLLESLIQQGISATVVLVDTKSFGDRRDLRPSPEPAQSTGNAYLPATAQRGHSTESAIPMAVRRQHGAVGRGLRDASMIYRIRSL